MESDEDDEETQASFCRFLDDNFLLPISAYAPGCVPKVKIKERLNKDRIKYLLSLHKMTTEEFLSAVSKNLKTALTWEDIYCDTLPINTLKRVDSVFKKGLFYYADPETPKISKSASVFFRKESFETDLNLGSRQRVREFEDLKTRLNTISKMSDVTLKRKLPIYNEHSNPRDVAFAVRNKVLPDFTSVKRDFLKNFINKLGEQNVIVFEFVDTSNRKEKANVDGFYLSPNAIVLKRRQDSFSREIFTLAHKLGHYLLNKEEIEEVDVVAFIAKMLHYLLLRTGVMLSQTDKAVPQKMGANGRAFTMNISQRKSALGSWRISWS